MKTAAAIVAFPRYIGLMLFISNFQFIGWALNVVHILEGFAGLALAILEGFAISYILSRRQLGFEKWDKIAITVVSAILLILLPVCATPYLIFLFDGTQLFGSDEIWLKFIWIAATASMPIFIIVGVALVENDPVDVQIMKAERLAEKKKRIAKIQCEADEIALEYDLKKKTMRREYRQEVKKEPEKKQSEWLQKLKKNSSEESDY